MKCAAALLAILGLAGCGQTGPLFLPDAEIRTPVEIKAAPPATATVPVQPAPAAEEDSDEQPPQPPAAQPPPD